MYTLPPSVMIRVIVPRIPAAHLLAVCSHQFLVMMVMNAQLIFGTLVLLAAALHKKSRIACALELTVALHLDSAMLIVTQRMESANQIALKQEISAPSIYATLHHRNVK